MMGKDSAILVAGIFNQLRVLREAVMDLEAVESEVTSLQGSQTMDIVGAVHMSFIKLQDQIAAMEETIASIAEATGEIPKL
ncbi:hypothetical protein L6218_14910 [Pseudomonas syringae pv. syringae]|uniref:hypothetical protein n=1 Tax=Pseudomonas TaxID=286 RepID=UPI001F1166BE|nr:hypothetical protein [Pseudomonas syringae]MCH5499510.1 hypothetical protein [Pseudomonas syringae pv. syringae]MCH5525655.1 hypothetical protein [Pseudomonas syringae pv. syringae]MCH5560751.1 hypothetical protein [Pseudomonas syringae pv. syringae]MCH5566001.1 hypothetical protein [Pseudomonas syringae pv. syringae]MCH5581275.1 hypothetical protein [Pseudomonas syringae pv. syringae]